MYMLWHPTSLPEAAAFNTAFYQQSGTSGHLDDLAVAE